MTAGIAEFQHHLVMPSGLDETRQIMRFIASEISTNTYVNIMAQYYPAGKVNENSFTEINRHITQEEYREAIEIVHQEGLYRLDPREELEHRQRW